MHTSIVRDGHKSAISSDNRFVDVNCLGADMVLGVAPGYISSTSAICHRQVIEILLDLSWLANDSKPKPVYRTHKILIDTTARLRIYSVRNRFVMYKSRIRYLFAWRIGTKRFSDIEIESVALIYAKLNIVMCKTHNISENSCCRIPTLRREVWKAMFYCGEWYAHCMQMSLKFIRKANT